MNPKYFRTPRPVRLFRSTPVSSFPIASCELARKSRWCELCSSPLVHDRRPEFSYVGVVVVVVSKVRHSKMTGDYVRCIHSVVSGGGFSQPTALAGMLSYRVPEQGPILGTANRRSLLLTVTTGNATYPIQIFHIVQSVACTVGPANQSVIIAVSSETQAIPTGLPTDGYKHRTKKKMMMM